MKRRHSISNLSKWTILSIGAFSLLLSLLFGLLAIIPIIGLIGTLGGVLSSMLWIFILGIWMLFNIGAGPRRALRAMVSFGLVGPSSCVSVLPFLGGILDFLISLMSLTLLYILISTVQREDREYNEKQGTA